MSNTSAPTIHWSLLPLLGIVFVTLKLCDVIDWSWWLVSIPFWINCALGIAIATVVLLFTMLSIWLAFIISLFRK